MNAVCEPDTAYPPNQSENMTELSPNPLIDLEKKYLKEDEDSNVVETLLQVRSETEVIQMKRR